MNLLGNMNNLQTYEEFNEGFKTRLAGLALAGALSVVAPSCTNLPSRVKDTEMVENKALSDKIDIYYVKTPQERYHIMISKSGKIISNTYYVSAGKTVVTHNHVYIDNDVDIIYFYRNGWSGKFYATDDPKDTDEDFDIINVNELKVWQETPDYVLLETDWGSDLLILKYKTGHNPEGPKTDLGGVRVGFTSIKGRIFVVKEESAW
jgi:hypothetical protein